MTLSRRLFAAFLPATAAAPVLAGMMPHPPPTAPVPVNPGFGTFLTKEATRLIAPPAYQKYLAAMELSQSINHQRYIRQNIQRSREMDSNIIALKSVSNQHKINMQIKHQNDRQKEERSFSESLIDSLGLRDYMKKRSELNGNGVEASAPSGGW